MKLTTLVLNVCLSSLVLAAAQDSLTPAVTWPHEASDLKPDPKLVFGRLDNGLRYLILPNAEPPKRVSMRLHIAAGSLMETDKQQGLAHFMEHMAFNGTKHYPANEMIEFFQRLGMAFGADTNAHTSFDETVYKLEMPDNDKRLLDQGMLWMRDVADGMIIGAEEIEKERGVILSEKNARDSVDFRTMIEGFKFGLPESLIPNRLPIGTEEVLKTAPRQQFLDFYKKWYTPERMTVIVVGDVKPNDIKPVIAEHFTDLKAPAKNTPNPSIGKVTTGNGLRTKVHTEKEGAQVTIQVETPRPSPRRPHNSETRRIELIRSLANAMLNRRFEILSKKPDSAFLAAGASSQDWMHFVESFGLEITSKPESWDKALAAGEQELRRAVLHGFTKSELTEAAANVMTALENEAKGVLTRKSRALADVIASNVSDRKVFTHPDDSLAWAKAELPKITVEQCHVALKEGWSSEDINIFIGGNLTLDDSEKKIAAVWKKSRGVEVAPQKEEAEAIWGYTSFGDPGKVTAEKVVEDLQITQVTFANGVRLNIKPTDFKKDTIEYSASFGDGKLTAPKTTPGLALFAQYTFENGALGKHSIDDLQRVLAGKTVDINFSVGDDAFSLTGKTNRKDLTNQFQLLAAFLSDPGWREDGVPRLKMGLTGLFQQLNHTPEGVMQSQGNAFMHGDDYRFVFPQQEEIAARTMGEVKEWLEPQLRTGYLEIGVVGDLEVKEVIAAAKATVGSLPARATERLGHEDLRTSVKFPGGVKEKEFAFDSKIPKSMALVLWPTTDRRKNVKLSRQLSLLSEIVSDRVRLKVREELGESYSPDVASMMSDTWTGYGQFMAMMSTDNKQAKKLTAIARDIAAGVAEKGISEDELARARKPILTGLAEQRRSNSYWLGIVVGPSQSKPERLDWARTMTDDFKDVTLTDLNRLAKDYLSADKATTLTIVSTAKTAEGKKEKTGK